MLYLFAPSLSQHVRCGFGASLPCEYAFSVPDGSGDILGCHEIRETPDILSDYKVQPVKNIAMPLQHFALIFLGEHYRRVLMESRNGFRTEFSYKYRPLQFVINSFKVLLKPVFYYFQMSCVNVPAEIRIDAYHVKITAHS